VDQQAQVVVPRVEVPGGGAGAIEVERVGTHRVQETTGASEERGEQQRGHEGRREERDERVAAPHGGPRALPAPAVRQQGQGERPGHRAQSHVINIHGIGRVADLHLQIINHLLNIIISSIIMKYVTTWNLRHVLHL